MKSGSVKHEQQQDTLGFVFAWPLAGVTEKPLLLAASLSAFSVDYFHPGAEKIFLVPESEVLAANEQLPVWVRDLVTIKGMAHPERFRDNYFRSRWIKTHAFLSLRRNTILLDADTLMVASVNHNDIAGVDCVGAAQDRVAVNFEEIYYRKDAQALFAKSGWLWPRSCDDVYFNTGVIVYRHCPEAERFAKCWESYWAEFVEHTGLHFDQAAFNRVAASLKSVAELPVAYNCPVVILPSLSTDAKVYHYYSSGSRLECLRSHLMGAALAEAVDRNDFSPNGLRKRLANGRHPYVTSGEPSRAYRDSGQSAFYVLARLAELPAEAGQWTMSSAKQARSRLRSSTKMLPSPIRRLGRFIRERFVLNND